MNWISVKDQMPKSTQQVLFCWKTPHGQNRVSSGGWVKRFHVEMTEDFELGEINPEDEESYQREGWYEWGWDLEYTSQITREVTHWMPMPKRAESDARDRLRKLVSENRDITIGNDAKVTAVMVPK